MRNNAISKRRQDQILELLHQTDKVNVKELSDMFDVSPITIRRDLDTLCDNGYVDRIHGGAVLKRNHRDEALFQEKGLQHIVEKRNIAKAAAEMIKEDATVFLNSGSTTLEVIKQIKNNHVRVITNNAATICVEKDPQVELFLVGGEYREASQSLIGDIAQQSLANVISSCTILGVNGINERFGLTSSVQQETSVNRTMVEQCNGPVIVVADSSKIGAVSNFPSVAIDAVTILITDSQADKEHLRAFEKSGIQVIIV
jgi:DeoR family transcriptional regulator, fructose operon transcriptional repressor